MLMCVRRRATGVFCMWMLNDETWSSRRSDVDQSPAGEDGNIKRGVVSRRITSIGVFSSLIFALRPRFNFIHGAAKCGFLLRRSSC